MILTLIRFTQVLSIGIWVGAIAYLSFGVAPVAFALAPTRHLAGQIVGQSIAKLYALGYICAAVYGVAIVADNRRAPAGPGIHWVLVVVAVMVLLIVLNQFVVGQRMHGLRAQMMDEFGGVDQTPRDHVLRTSFGRLHGVSSLLMMGNLGAGLLLLFLTVRRFQ